MEWCHEALVLSKTRAPVVNAGNSNAFTGQRGRAAVKAIAARGGAASLLPAIGHIHFFYRRDAVRAEHRQLAAGQRPSSLARTPIGGRIVMAVRRDCFAISFSGIQVAERGLAVSGSAMTKRRSPPHLKGQEVEIGVDLGIGDGRATVCTCDLTHGYILINVDYRS